MVARRSTFQATTWSATPMSVPATKAAGIDRMPVTTAAASAGSRIDGPAAASKLTPWLGALSTTARAASPPAIDHSRSDSWLTGMPTRRARSMFSAMPRTAVPASVPLRNQTRPASTSGTTATSSRSLPLKVTGSIVHCLSDSEVSKPGMRSAAPNQPGMNRAMPPSSWARPIVATVRTRRGALMNRRMTSRSVSAPTTTPAATPMTADSSHGQPLPRVSAAASPPPTPPMAP